MNEYIYRAPLEFIQFHCFCASIRGRKKRKNFTGIYKFAKILFSDRFMKYTCQYFKAFHKSGSGPGEILRTIGYPDFLRNIVQISPQDFCILELPGYSKAALS